MDDIQAIIQVKARYGRAADTRDWDLLRTTVTDDYSVDTGAGPTKGIEAFLERVRGNPEDVMLAHHAVMPEIEVLSPSTATGIWAVHIMARYPDGRTMDGFGHYHDTYAKVDGSWRLRSSRLEWLHGTGRAAGAHDHPG